MAESKSIDRYMTPDEVADLLQVQRQTLANWRHHGKGPDYIKTGHFVRYPQSAVVRWMDSNLTRVTA